MSLLNDSTTTQSHGAGSTDECVEQENFVDGGNKIHPKFLYAIVEYVLALPQDSDSDGPSAIDASVTTPVHSRPISQNPYHAWTAWTRQGPTFQAPAAAPNTSSSWTGVSSYDGFWSKFNNSKLQVQNSAYGLAPAGSQFPFTNTAAPCDIVVPTRREATPRPVPNSNQESVSYTCGKSSLLKGDLTLAYTVVDLVKEFPSLAHLIKVIPETSFVCNRFGCGARVNGDLAAIVKHGEGHRLGSQTSEITCVYDRCNAKVAIQDFEQHVGAHLQYREYGTICGVCKYWFANAELATNHLTQPCPTLLSRGHAEGYPSPSKKARPTRN